MTSGSFGAAHLTGLATALADRYRLGRELGAGGMATVWLAEDLRHGRRVAIKVLHPELSAVLGPERFLAEIRTTAGLQHPHILPLFDSGSADGHLYYVMPYVDGETLRSLLQRERQLPVGDALRIATEVADALQYAHAHGVVHRDIKPENILLQDGHALVADFGIALAVEQAGGVRMTQTGLSLGTPQYMSPEQAMGDRQVGARTDIYSLGVVTYEMLAGEPPFTGPNAQAIVARILTEEPPSVAAHRRSVPASVDAAVETAMEKLPADRWSTAAAFASALSGDAPQGTRTRHARSARGTTAAMRSVPRTVALGALGLLALAIAFWLGGRLRVPVAPPLVFGRATRVTWDPGLEVQPAISPDGKMIAYAAGTSTDTRIYVRQVAGGRANRLTDDSAIVEASPSWSPDGARILFLARGAVFSAAAAGGPARQELPAPRGGVVTSAVWAPDGQTIAYTVGDSLLVHTRDGEGRLVTRLPEPTLCAWSPDATNIACGSGNARYLTIGQQFGNQSPNRIVVCRVRDGARTVLTDSTSISVSPVWSHDGRWLYYVSNRDGRGDIYAQRIGSDGMPSGAVMRLTTGLGAQSISLSADGSRMAYAVYANTANVWSVPLTSGSTVTSTSAVPVTTGEQEIENVAVSRDGRWLLYDSNVAGNSDVYRVPLVGGLRAAGAPERITTDPADDFAPELSPDGTEVAFHSWRAGSRDIWVQPLDGRPTERVTSSPQQEWLPVWSPDARALAYEGFTTGSVLRTTWIARREANGGWGRLVRRLAPASWPAWSPDGHWLAFATGVAGGSLGVVPVDSGPSRIVLAPARDGMTGAEKPQWSPDGRTLYFKSHDARGAASIWSVPVAGGTPRLLVRLDDPTRPSYRPQWAFGNGRAYFAIDDRQSDLWVMDASAR